MTSTIYPKKFLALHFRCAYPTLLCVVTLHLGMWLIYVNVCFFKNSAKKMQILCLVLEIVLGLYEVTLSHASPMASTVNITTPTPFATSLARCHLFVPTTASLLWYHLPSCNQREGNLCGALFSGLLMYCLQHQQPFWCACRQRSPCHHPPLVRGLVEPKTSLIHPSNRCLLCPLTLAMGDTTTFWGVVR